MLLTVESVESTQILVHKNYFWSLYCLFLKGYKNKNCYLVAVPLHRNSHTFSLPFLHSSHFGYFIGLFLQIFF